MTRGDMLKYAKDGVYYMVSVLVEETGTVIDYAYIESEEEKAKEHALMLVEKSGEKYVSFMKCNYRSCNKEEYGK